MKNNKEMIDAVDAPKQPKYYRKELQKNPVVENAEKDGLSMMYHGILFILKWFFIARSFMCIVSGMFNEVSILMLVDDAFYLAMGIASGISLWKHNNKSGVYALFVFMALELAMNFTVYFYAKFNEINVPGLDGKMVSWIFGSLVIAVPTFIYYRKRWRYLL